MSLFLADIYGNPPNPALQGHPGYGLFLVMLVMVFVVVVFALNRKNRAEIDTDEAEKEEAEKERLRDLHIKTTLNQNDKSGSKD
jgi:cbb3-type cytochrome oxidase subunit 3